MPNSHTSSRDEVLEIAKDQYTKAKTAFEDHRHTVTLLQASLTPQSVLSLYGDVGRLIEETQILLYEHFPFLSPFPSPEIEQRYCSFSFSYSFFFYFRSSPLPDFSLVSKKFQAPIPPQHPQIPLPNCCPSGCRGWWGMLEEQGMRAW